MKEYICTKNMLIQLYNEDGILLKDNYFELKVGSIWSSSEDLNTKFSSNYIMLKSNELGWIKISINNFRRHFKIK